jgi:hypothetical protein
MLKLFLLLLFLAQFNLFTKLYFNLKKLIRKFLSIFSNYLKLIVNHKELVKINRIIIILHYFKFLHLFTSLRLFM